MAQDIQGNASAKKAVLRRPEEPLIMKYVSAISGHVYDAEMVDHLADMLLIFYAAGGTALGAIFGCFISILFLTRSTPTHSMFLVPALAFVGALLGCLSVLSALSFRGVLRWDRYQYRRTISLKASQD